MGQSYSSIFTLLPMQKKDLQDLGIRKRVLLGKGNLVRRQVTEEDAIALTKLMDELSSERYSQEEYSSYRWALTRNKNSFIVDNVDIIIEALRHSEQTKRDIIRKSSLSVAPKDNEEEINNCYKKGSTRFPNVIEVLGEVHKKMLSCTKRIVYYDDTFLSADSFLVDRDRFSDLIIEIKEQGDKNIFVAAIKENLDNHFAELRNYEVIESVLDYSKKEVGQRLIESINYYNGEINRRNDSAIRNNFDLSYTKSKNYCLNRRNPNSYDKD